EGGYERERQVYIEKPNVMFQPNTGDMRGRVYRKTRVLLMPSSYESYGMTAVEACVSGIPVVASPTPGLVESLHTAGFHVDLEDREEWYRIVKELLTSEDAWKEASDRAIERAARLSAQDELDGCVEAIERGDDGHILRLLRAMPGQVEEPSRRPLPPCARSQRRAHSSQNRETSSGTWSRGYRSHGTRRRSPVPVR